VNIIGRHSNPFLQEGWECLPQERENIGKEKFVGKKNLGDRLGLDGRTMITFVIMK